MSHTREGAGIKGFLAMVVGCLLFISMNPIIAKAETPSIQQQIDATKPGDTIELVAGVYNESININKPIHLIGIGDVTLIQNGADPAITIQSDNVVIENLHIRHMDDHGESPAILLQGDHNTLHHIGINTSSFGIQLDEANDNNLSGIDITGNKGQEMIKRQHGIELWKSDNNEIQDVRIKHVKDGMYLEKSNGNTVYQNVVSDSRYGVHLMFTQNTVLTENEAYENVSGIYIMGADGTVAKHNTLRDNRENVQSLGLLLFDTVNATIEENYIVNNRIGILIEGASENILALNNIQGNYIGMQFKGSENNDILNNAFVANVVQGQAKDSSDNHTNGNYWGDHLGLDITGDHRSSLTYKVDPFFLNITNEYPVFQLLFQAPGMGFLEQLIYTPEDQQFIDQAPLMANPLAVADDISYDPFSLFIFCLFLFMIGILIIYLGVGRNEKI
jgi:nitrous oxidase accessory protein